MVCRKYEMGVFFRNNFRKMAWNIIIEMFGIFGGRYCMLIRSNFG